MGRKKVDKRGSKIRLYLENIEAASLWLASARVGTCNNINLYSLLSLCLYLLCSLFIH